MVDLCYCGSQQRLDWSAFSTQINVRFYSLCARQIKFFWAELRLCVFFWPKSLQPKYTIKPASKYLIWNPNIWNNEKPVKKNKAKQNKKQFNEKTDLHISISHVSVLYHCLNTHCCSEQGIFFIAWLVSINICSHLCILSCFCLPLITPFCHNFNGLNSSSIELNLVCVWL